MSLIGTRHHSGPSATVSTIAAKIAVLATARRWRRKRRQDSRPGDTLRRTGGPASAAGAPTSAERNAWVEPGIEEVRDEIEQDDEAGEDERHGHDHRRVVGEDRTDEERSDAGDAEDLLGDDGAAEHRR